MLTVPSVHHFSSLLVVRMDLPVIGAPQSSSGFPRGNFEGPVIIDSENPATLRCDSLMIWCINKCTCISMYREVCILYIYIYINFLTTILFYSSLFFMGHPGFHSLFAKSEVQVAMCPPCLVYAKMTCSLLRTVSNGTQLVVMGSSAALISSSGTVTSARRLGNVGGSRWWPHLAGGFWYQIWWFKMI